MKAIFICPDVIAQTINGTVRIRASVMRFGILKEKQAPAERRGRLKTATGPRHPHYSGGAAIAPVAKST
jgi:hypothetical protein